ncbi:MAG: NosD domain-containing protein [Methanotrichaceae archaeon]
MSKLMTVMLIIIFVGLSTGADARMYVVDDDGHAQYKLIGDAVAVANSGDKIYVYPGLYQEHFILDKGLSIMPLPGEKEPCVLTSDGSEIGIEIQADGCKIEGLTITDFRGPGIYVESDKNQIKKNVFVDNVHGLLLNKASQNVIENNEERGGYCGIVLVDSDENTITNNNAEGCVLAGIDLNSAQKNTITDSNATECLCGIYLNNNSCNSLMERNIVSECRYGVLMEYFCDENELRESRLEKISTAINVPPNIASRLTTTALVDSTAIGLVSCSNNQIHENTVLNSTSGMTLFSSEGNKIRGNQLAKLSKGIIVLDSSANVLEENSLSEVRFCLYVDGTSEESFDNYIAESNCVDGKPILYYYNQSDLEIQDKECAHLTLARCQNCTVKGNAITNGLLSLYSSRNNYILENNASRCYGMLFRSSSDNLIAGNRACDNRLDGIHLIESINNTITNNTICQNNRSGIFLSRVSDDNNIVGNTIVSNSIGINLNQSSVNSVYHNNLVDNTEQARDSGEENFWDWGPLKGGNYWSDHECVGNPCQNSSKSIGETAVDYYPFQNRDGWL